MSSHLEAECGGYAHGKAVGDLRLEEGSEQARPFSSSTSAQASDTACYSSLELHFVTMSALSYFHEKDQVNRACKQQFEDRAEQFEGLSIMTKSDCAFRVVVERHSNPSCQCRETSALVYL